MIPPGWANPITSPLGQAQHGVDPLRLLPSRRDLTKPRLEFHRTLLLAGRPRVTPVLVTAGGIIYDGHHAIRAAAEEGRTVDVLVTAGAIAPTADSILGLPVR